MGSLPFFFVGIIVPQTCSPSSGIDSIGICNFGLLSIWIVIAAKAQSAWYNVNPLYLNG